MMNNDIDPNEPIEVEEVHPNNPGAEDHYEVIGKHYFIHKDDCFLVKSENN